MSPNFRRSILIKLKGGGTRRCRRNEMKRRLAAQAETFAAVLNTLLQHRKSGVVAINYWQLIDSEAQDRGGNMFNEDGSPRPAYYAIQNALENPPPG